MSSSAVYESLTFAPRRHARRLRCRQAIAFLKPTVITRSDRARADDRRALLRALPRPSPERHYYAGTAAERSLSRRGRRRFRRSLFAPYAAAASLTPAQAAARLLVSSGNVRRTRTLNPSTPGRSCSRTSTWAGRLRRGVASAAGVTSKFTSIARPALPCVGQRLLCP